MEAGHILKNGGERNDLLDRIGNDEAFMQIKTSLKSIAEPSNFIGRAPRQVDDFVTDVVDTDLE